MIIVYLSLALDVVLYSRALLDSNQIQSHAVRKLYQFCACAITQLTHYTNIATHAQENGRTVLRVALINKAV